MKPSSDRRFRISIGALVSTAVVLFGSAEVIEWRAHHFAGVPYNHVVGIEENGRPYMRPSGWLENRTTVTRRQFEAYQQNEQLARALSLPGIVLFCVAVLLDATHTWDEKPPPADDLA